MKDTVLEIKQVANNEIVTRTLSREWVVRGKLQLSAFALQPGETYISVNRQSVDTYMDDVRGFLFQHPDFLVEKNMYSCALLNVGDIRHVEVKVDGEVVGVDVEVEPRAKHMKSHAGIFTRYGGKNIKTGQVIKIEKQQKGISSDDILLDVRLSLLDIASVENYILSESKETI